MVSARWGKTTCGESTWALGLREVFFFSLYRLRPMSSICKTFGSSLVSAGPAVSANSSSAALKNDIVDIGN
jgi:hypothetical protein